VAAVALLPIRLFFGATFVYAGFDKLLDPRFFDPSSPASLQAQMAGFARASPIGGLVRLGEPIAIPIGLLIAIVEIAIGLGAISGLAFRVAAIAGAALSLLFWLTASWSTHPFYVGADLPYAAGWVTLALAGHGGLLVPRRFLAPDATSGVAQPVPGRRRRPDEASPSPGRRAFLQSGLLAVLALTAASLAVPFRLAGLQGTEDSGPADASELPTESPGSSAGGPPPTASAAATASGSAPPAAGLPVANVADVARNGSATFTVPFDAPAPLPAGDPGVIVRLTNGTFVAFDAVCTHAGCTVEWDAADGVLFCPCHGAAFDPAHQAAVIDGPTNQPLASLPIVVDAASGRILLRT
jgi:thiosulfate dehydrogenase [quinone] large subunit